MALNTAIRHLKNGDWQKAHTVVQNDASQMGCWAHGIVHMLEGDLGNARYWYRRAGRPFPRERDASAEIDALVAHVKAQAQAPAAQSPRVAGAADGRKEPQSQRSQQVQRPQQSQQAQQAQQAQQTQQTQQTQRTRQAQQAQQAQRTPPASSTERTPR